MPFDSAIPSWKTSSAIRTTPQMTTTWAGGTTQSEYDARIRRAERLSAQHSFASEFLNFYKHVAAFQKRFAQRSRRRAA